MLDVTRAVQLENAIETVHASNMNDTYSPTRKFLFIMIFSTGSFTDMSGTVKPGYFLFKHATTTHDQAFQSRFGQTPSNFISMGGAIDGGFVDCGEVVFSQMN